MTVSLKEYRYDGENELRIKDVSTTAGELRKKKGMTQAELAVKAGITQTSLSHIESNTKKPHKSTVEKLCEGLEIPIQMFYFLTLTEEDIPEG